MRQFAALDWVIVVAAVLCAVLLVLFAIKRREGESES